VRKSWENAVINILGILHAISQGKRRVIDIAKEMKLDRRTVLYYLEDLQEWGYVKMTKKDGVWLVEPNLEKVMPYNGVVFVKAGEGRFFIVNCPYFHECGCGKNKVCRLAKEIPEDIKKWLEKE